MEVRFGEELVRLENDLIVCVVNFLWFLCWERSFCERGIVCLIVFDMCNLFF